MAGNIVHRSVAEPIFRESNSMIRNWARRREPGSGNARQHSGRTKKTPGPASASSKNASGQRV